MSVALTSIVWLPVAERAALVDLRVVRDPGLRRDREDVDDHGAGDRRVAAAGRAADRDRRDRRKRDLRDLRVGDDRVDRRRRLDRERPARRRWRRCR